MDIKLDTKKFGEIIFKIDESDYKKFVQNRKIYVSKMCNDKFYLIRDDKQYLHRLIMGFIPKDLVVDHINGDTLDNQKSNLRLVSRSLNSKNTEKRKFKGEDIFEILISPLSNKKLALKFNCSSCLISKIRTGILYDKFFPEILRSENIKRRQNVYRI